LQCTAGSPLPPLPPNFPPPIKYPTSGPPTATCNSQSELVQTTIPPTTGSGGYSTPPGSSSVTYYSNSYGQNYTDTSTSTGGYSTGTGTGTGTGMSTGNSS